MGEDKLYTVSYNLSKDINNKVKNGEIKIGNSLWVKKPVDIFPTLLDSCNYTISDINNLENLSNESLPNQDSINKLHNHITTRKPLKPVKLINNGKS